MNECKKYDTTLASKEWKNCQINLKRFYITTSSVLNEIIT